MRSYRELWLWLGAALLTLATGFIGIALAYFAKESHYSIYASWQFRASCGAFLLAFACFLAAVFHWVPPWVKTSFPKLKFSIYGFGSYATHHLMPNNVLVPTHLVSFPANITNLEREQNANLTIVLRVVPVSVSDEVPAMVYTSPVNWAIDPSLSLSPLPRTINLPPGTTTSGDLVFEVINSPPSTQRTTFRLVVSDHVSDIKMITDAFRPSIKFTTSDMRRQEEGSHGSESGNGTSSRVQKRHVVSVFVIAGVLVWKIALKAMRLRNNEHERRGAINCDPEEERIPGTGEGDSGH
jgi:hypothetical protein